MRWHLPITVWSSDQLVRGSVNLVANSLSATGLGFVSWVVVTRLFEVDQVGAAAALISAASLTAGLAFLGAPGALTRFLPVVEDRTRLVVTALTISLTAGVLLGSGVAAWLALDDGSSLSSPVAAVAFVLFVVALVAKATTEAAVIALRASQVALQGTLMANAVKIASLGVLGWLAAGAVGIVAAHAIAALANVARLAAFLRSAGYLTRPRADLAVVQQVGGYAASHYINGFIGGLPVLALPVLVRQNLGEEAAGYWYVASLIGTAMALVPAAVGQSLLVEASHRTADLGRLAWRSMRVLSLVSSTIALAVVVLAPWLLSIFGSGYAAESVEPLRILAASTLMSPTIYVLGVVYFVRRRIAPLMLVNAANAVVVLSLAAASTTITGVAWAWAAGEVVYVVLFLLLLPFFPARSTRVDV